MKTLLISACLLISASTFAQSESFSLLKERLGKAEDVYSMRVGGFFLDIVLELSGEDIEEEVGEIRSVRFINIPQRELRSRGLKMSGFEKILEEDGFERMVSVKEHGETVTVYLREEKRDNLYFMLVEESDEVTAFEIRGNLDPNRLIEKCSRDEIKF